MKNILTFFTFLLTMTLQAQDTLQLHSKYFQKRTSVLIQKPTDYNISKNYPVVYLLHGYSEDYTQWNRITDLQALANTYQIIFVCPEGGTGYYLNSPLLSNSQFESFFFKELAPYIRANYAIDQRNIFISGLSMGGYGALRLFITHQEYFNTAASSSGALDFDYHTFKEISLQFFGTERMTYDLTANIGDSHQTDWTQYNISTLLKIHPTFHKGFMLDCGLDDPLWQQTEKIKNIAIEKKIPIRYATQPGGHNAKYWKQALNYHLVYFQEHLNH